VDGARAGYGAGMASTPVAVVLAAGLGTRMRSPLAKVLHPLLGRPMVGWVVHALREAGADCVVVVNHQAEAVMAALPGCRFARQQAPLGTGDALRSALALLPDDGPVLVTAGDTPLVTAAGFTRLLEAHARSGAPVTVASFEVDDPTGYGRIVRDAGGVRIVEQAECTPAQAAIREVNSGAYVFQAAYLRARLPTLAPHPPKGEFYLTDLVGEGAAVCEGFAASDFMGVNDRAALAEARGILRRRVNRAWALAGVDFEDLDGAQVDAEVALAPDASVGLGAVLTGGTRVSGRVGPGCVVRDSVIEGDVGPHCVVNETTVHAGAILHAQSVSTGAVLHAGAQAGPFARLRPGAVLGAESHVGNFVEVKNTTLHPGAKANHLTYLGDAEVGAKANVGAGTITCNYDGFGKHRTVIGARAFIGSNTALVAPVTIGEGALVGAGSTVTEDVPAEAVAIARGKQVTREGLAPRLRQRAKERADAVKAARAAAGGGS
jgi:bifunctional UDP-N-acetylglucosamine pyrophosphorylase/glucosamine-1-phosphate N-acetyltransferase